MLLLRLLDDGEEYPPGLLLPIELQGERDLLRKELYGDGDLLRDLRDHLR